MCFHFLLFSIFFIFFHSCWRAQIIEHRSIIDLNSYLFILIIIPIHSIYCFFIALLSASKCLLIETFRLSWSSLMLKLWLSNQSELNLLNERLWLKEHVIKLCSYNIDIRSKYLFSMNWWTSRLSIIQIALYYEWNVIKYLLLLLPSNGQHQIYRPTNGIQFIKPKNHRVPYFMIFHDLSFNENDEHLRADYISHWTCCKIRHH